jgi:hypothetical protein
MTHYPAEPNLDSIKQIILTIQATFRSTHFAIALHPAWQGKYFTRIRAQDVEIFIDKQSSISTE